MAERILITGGAGFIGSHLAAAHVADGDEVNVLVRPGSVAAPRWGTALYQVDLGDAAAVRAAFETAAPTIVYHLATDTGRGGPEPDGWPSALRDDVVNLLNILMAAEAVAPRVLVRTGSLAEYGGGADPATEDQRERPGSAYAAALVAAAHYCRVMQARLSYPILTARLALTYGPGQSDKFLLPMVIRRLLDRMPVEIRRPGSRRDLVHVDDIVRGLRALAMSRLDGGEIVNFGTGVAPSMREMAMLACEATGADGSLLRFGSDGDDGIDPVNLCIAPGRALRLLGWKADIQLRRGIAATVEATRMGIDR